MLIKAKLLFDVIMSIMEIINLILESSGAYCNEEKKPTREHIIPDGFIRAMNIDEQIRWTESVPCRVINSDF